jgi:hypothetical protein
MSTAGVPRVLRAEGGGELRLFDVDAGEDREQRDEHEGEDAQPAVEGDAGAEEGNRPPV